MALGYSPVVAVLMSVVTAIMGGIMRDVMTGHATLLSSKELYATPVLFGSALYIGLVTIGVNDTVSAFVGFIFIAFFRFIAIRYNISYPERLMIGPRQG